MSNRLRNGITAMVWIVAIIIIYSLVKNPQKPIQPSTEPTDTYSRTEDNTSTTQDKITYSTCSVCGNQFSGNGYEEVSEGVWQQCDNNTQSWVCSSWCGRKHTAEMNSLINNTSDGRVYDADECSLCKGTGIEKNMSSLSNEYGRQCPMCGGSGRQGY